MTTPDAGKPATGGKGGSGSATGGTGGSEPDPVDDPPSTSKGQSGGCAYGGTPQGMSLALLIALGALLRRRRR
jgi:uncharacterized protein (TIGR03382 family)